MMMVMTMMTETASIPSIQFSRKMEVKIKLQTTEITTTINIKSRYLWKTKSS